MTYFKDVRLCCVLCFTVTWLTPDIPDCAIQTQGFSLPSGKVRGGYFLINILWCSEVAVLASPHSPDLEYLIVKPEREFTSAILTAVYIPTPCRCQASSERTVLPLSIAWDKTPMKP